MCAIPKRDAFCVSSGLPVLATSKHTVEGEQAIRAHENSLQTFLEDQGATDLDLLDARDRRVLLQLLHALHDRIVDTILEPERMRQASSFQRLRRAAHLLTPTGTNAREIYELSGGDISDVETTTRDRIRTHDGRSLSLFSESSKCSSEESATTVNLSQHLADTARLVKMLLARVRASTRYIRFSDNDLRADDAANLLAKVPEHITAIDFSRNALGPLRWSPFQISKAHKRSKFAHAVAHASVREINLSSNCLGVPHARLCCDLFSAIRSCSSLVRLDLSSNSLGQDACDVLGKHLLARNSTLKSLDLQWNRITDAGPLNLHRNKALAELDLSYNAIGSRSVDAFAASLSRNNSLQHLNLAHNRLSARDLDTLASALRQNRSILGLHLEGCCGGRAGVDALGHVHVRAHEALDGPASLRMPTTTCWLCAQWEEMRISLIPPSSSCGRTAETTENGEGTLLRRKLSSVLSWDSLPHDVVVRVHFCCDNWAPIPMRRIPIPFGGSIDSDDDSEGCSARFEIRRMMPPDTDVVYYFSVVVPARLASRLLRDSDETREVDQQKMFKNFGLFHDPVSHAVSLAGRVARVAATVARAKSMATWLRLQRQVWICALDIGSIPTHVRGIAHNTHEFRVLCFDAPQVQALLRPYRASLEVIFEHFAMFDEEDENEDEDDALSASGWMKFCGMSRLNASLSDADLRLCFLWSTPSTGRRRLSFERFLESIVRVAAIINARTRVKSQDPPFWVAYEPFDADGLHIAGLSPHISTLVKAFVNRFREGHRARVSSMHG
eukprot:g1235.t1